MKPFIEELLEKEEGRFRILTGDYLNASDPDGLQDLLDLKALYPEKCWVYIYSTENTRSFHPKSYLMFDVQGQHVAYVGSSNISHTALVGGVEWNYRIASSVDPSGWSSVSAEFDLLLENQNVKELDQNWLEEYRTRRQKTAPVVGGETSVEPEEPYSIPTPHKIQQEALIELRKTRELGNRAGLVVLATGIGKTWLAAFDTASDLKQFQRVLFVAHREEILNQSLKTFRRINPRATMGLYNGSEKNSNADIIFASIQTLSRVSHLRIFSENEFDYIVVDEFHHAAANTYRRLIDYFKPKFMLGLTATPERTDGGDLLALCDENLVYRCDVPRGIELGLLSAYHYYGVPDNIDYENIPWRSRKFDEAALSQAVETEERTKNIYEQWLSRGKDRTIAFCVSRSHANYMCRWFRDKGVKCAAVHSGPESDPRTTSLEQLETGTLQVVFAIDMFNEGVDIPALDTVMMLRPTESSIIWLQQFGRGLRKKEDKVLTVIDYIGNHRSFLLKLRALLNIQQGGDGVLAKALADIKSGELSLPNGCEVTYELEAIDIMKALLRKSSSEQNALVQYYKDFREEHGERPSASEAYHDGYLPSGAKAVYGSWLGLVSSMGDLDPISKEVLRVHGVILKGLEATSMTKSYKMVLLRALLNLDGIPGAGVEIESLTENVSYLASRSEKIATDFGQSLQTNAALKRSLQDNPIAAWTGKKALGGEVLFAYENDVFRYIPTVETSQRESFQSLVREILEWRLASYLDRQPLGTDTTGWLAKVDNHLGMSVLMLPEPTETKVVADGWYTVVVDDQEFQCNVEENIISEVAQGESGTNMLPTLLRQWFGPDAGLPGTNFNVLIETDGKLWRAIPLLKDRDDNLSVHKRYTREQIPQFFGEKFNTGKWRSGHITAPTKDPKHIILLVTLEKDGMQEDHQYADKFLSKDIFQWQSQNATTQESNRGLQLVKHKELELAVHLFVRKTKKQGNRAAPFVYCGEVEFVSWEGSKPITVQWRLANHMPDSLNEI